MKTLFLLRHAKADWHNSNQNDFERMLNDVGKRSAIFVGDKLKNLDVKVDKIISSSAVRAITTARFIAPKLHYPEADIIEDEKLYLVDPLGLRSYVEKLDDANDNVMIVAHNPGITAFASYITGEHLGSMPTCSVYAVTFNIDTWRAIGACAGTCKFYEYPKKHIEFMEGQ